MIISTNPNQKRITPRKSFTKANWDKYREILSIYSNRVNVGDTLEDIDDHIKEITELIQKADRETIPLIQHRTLPHPDNSPETDNIITEMKELIVNINTRGPDPPKYRALQNLRRRLAEHLQQQQTDSRNNLITSVDS